MGSPAPVSTYPTDRAGGYDIRLSEIEAYRSQGGGKPSGGKFRFYCPIHGGDSQQSLEYDPETGRFYCFACQAWGYTTEARERRARDRAHDADRVSFTPVGPRSTNRPPLRLMAPKENAPAYDQERLTDRMLEFLEALPGSPGEEYLFTRGIPSDLAARYGIGYAAPGQWPGRTAPGGRVVFPHYIPPGPDGAPQLANFYGRAVELGGRPVDRVLRHDHLPGRKGWFNRGAVDFVNGGRAVYVCEGSFDAVALIAAGVSRRALALFGLDSLRWDWLPADALIVLALDADQSAAERVRDFLYESLAAGREVVAVDPAMYGGEKDAAEAWRRGVLDVEGLRAIGEETNQRRQL